MRHSQRRSQAGFTIVETIIVLAIAGFILVLILGLLPALGRNGRNNQRRQDVAATLDFVSRYELNHSAAFPDCGHGAFPSCLGGSNLLANANMTYYSTDPQIVIQSLTSGGNPPSGNNPNNNVDVLYIYNYQKCDPNNPGQSSGSSADYTNVVALYAIEASGGASPKCEQL